MQTVILREPMRIDKICEEKTTRGEEMRMIQKKYREATKALYKEAVVPIYVFES